MFNYFYNKLITNTQNADDEIKLALSSIQDQASSQLLSLDKELEEKILNSEKEILKSRDDQMKNIHEEIFNITKIAISKITDIKLLDDDINRAVKSYKGKIN